MRAITPLELGLVFWAEQNSAGSLGQLKSFGLTAGQLGVPPEFVCKGAVEDWSSGLIAGDFAMTSAVCSYKGEDYADLATIHRSVGFTTPEYRSERIARTKEVADFGHALGIGAVSCHLGFIPNDPTEKLYVDLRDLTREICDHCAGNGQNFVLETGQESAEILLAFIANVERDNLKVNFDPANMIMYQSGDPMVALEMLSPHVISVHCKDATAINVGGGKLGAECRLGDGQVGFPGFLETLKKIGYQGLLCIEREEPDTAQRTADVHAAVERLKQWKADAGL
ncbi:sugar phosphate isomerase/epimerase family protein [Granulicella sibirica]|uniref:Xylose isomerase-like TIM barrel domain-containing protein n=1 Tax=Granulicella sibirica TaxID=2479048 RepID=A0A4Q0SYQ0_9BACT|nr:sugar phosphate isomerase/epimerase family protein [Granulicella sibirica]RXH54659.1 hypothetical protein GRAN_3763 [Granulicella sibirica]